MNKKYTLISISILTALYSQQSVADRHAQCVLGVPHFTGEVVKGDVNNLPVYIEADKAEINQPTQAIYQGNVDLKQGNRHLVGNSVEVKQTGEGKQAQRWAYLRGGFDYKDNQINLLGNDASFNLDSKNGNVTDADYQLVGRQGRGKAQEIELGDNYDIINNINENPALSVGSAMGESRVAVSGNDTIAVVSASASETSADGLLFTVFAYENATSDDDINVVDSEFSVCTEEDLVSPLATRAAKKSYTIGDVDEDGYINSSDASRVLRAISIHEDSCDRNCKNKEILPVKEAKDNMLFYFPKTTFGPEAADVFDKGKIIKKCADDILGYYSCISSGKNYSDLYLGHVGEVVIVD